MKLVSKVVIASRCREKWSLPTVRQFKKSLLTIK